MAEQKARRKAPRLVFEMPVTPLRVLVVDDLEQAAMLLGVIVKRMGHSVSLAHTGREAIEKARIVQPEVVFLDIGLPDVDGYEVCRELRREEWGGSAAIVAVTGHDDPADISRAALAGFDRHVVKPMEFSVLREILQGKSPR